MDTCDKEHVSGLEIKLMVGHVRAYGLTWAPAALHFC